MPFLSFILSILIAFSSPIWASESQAQQHRYPESKATMQAANTQEVKQGAKASYYPCSIEILNDSFSNITVYGRYNDGVPLTPFNVYSYEYSHYIDMYYYGYCHSGMYLDVVTFGGYNVFSGYVYTGSTVHIVPYFNGKKPQVSIQKPAGR